MNNLKVKKMNKKKKGFTLIELIIVIAIIAILAAMAIPKFNAVRVDAKVSNDVAAAKNIQSATQTLMANSVVGESEGDIEITGKASGATDDTLGEQIAARVDNNKGTATIIKPEALSGAEFLVNVTDGKVTVSAKNGDDEYQLVPEDPAQKEAYAKAARK